ncbi:MAG: M12 family metallopeptidase [Bacteroidia bacterium]
MKKTNWKWMVPVLAISLAGCKKEQKLSPVSGDSSAECGCMMPELAEPGKTGEDKVAYVNGTAIHYKDVNGRHVMEGDIILSDEQLRSQKGTGRSNLAYRWPSNTIYYTIDPTLPNQSRVSDAIAHYNMNTSVKWIARTSQSNYVTFRPAGGCASMVGMIGGQQFIDLGTDCSTGNAIHEMAHAAGVWHEQTRADRDANVVVHWGNIQSGAENNFKTYLELGTDGFDFSTGFDFNSVMLYGSDFFSGNGGPTLTKLDNTTYTVQRVGLSLGDMQTLYYMYPQPSVPTEELYMIENSKFYAVDNTTGAYSHVGSPVWTGTEAMTSLSGLIYAVENSRLYRIDKNYGTYVQLGGAVWTNTDAMTSLNSYLYIVENSHLYKVDPSNGSYVQIGTGNWVGTEGLTSYNNMLYLVENSRLYRVDPTSGTYVQLGGASWTGTKALTTLGTWLYLVENSRLYKVDPTNGSYTQLGAASWTNTWAMTTYSGMLYIAEGTGLYRADPSTGSYVQVGTGNWSNTQGLTN